MFFSPHVFKGSFNRYYLIASSSSGLPLGWKINSVNLQGCTESFVRQLEVPESYWRQLLLTQSHIDLRHVQQSDSALIAGLLDSGRLRAYQVLGPEQRQQLASCAVLDNKGVKYVFLPENASLLINTTQQRRFNSRKDAESFLSSVTLKDEQVETLTSFFKSDASVQLSKREQLAHALVTGALAVGVAPASAPAISQSSSAQAPSYVKTGYAPSTPPPPASAPPPVLAPVKPANPPAKSLEECEQRLATARERLIENGYQSKYTDEQLQALAAKGALDDRFVARLIKDYAKDDDYLGRPVNGEVKYWSTTFNQMENADTDPNTLSQLFGIDYDPAGSYTLVVVDTQAKGAGQSTTIVPTYEKLGGFAKTEIKDIDPVAVDKVMTPEYSQEYAEHMEEFNKQGLDVKEEKDIKYFADDNFSSDADNGAFQDRMKINQQLGANEHYTGNGTTKNLLPGCPNKCGVMETFSYDKSPQTLANLETSGSAKRIAAKPFKVS